MVHCGQMVGWIKMKLGMHVGLGPGHIVLDGNPAPHPQRGTAPNFRPICCGQMACMDQDATWHGAGGGPGPGDLVLDGDPAPSPLRKGTESYPTIFGPCLLSPIKSTIFRPFLLWTNDWMYQDATRHGESLRPGDYMYVLDGDPSPLRKGGGAPPPTKKENRPMFIVVKRQDGPRRQLAWSKASVQATLC